MEFNLPAICYFWHITDFHYDPRFSLRGDTKKGCWPPEYEGASRAAWRPAGRFGDFSCDAPWELIESAAKSMMSRHSDNVEFVLWTGDALSHALSHAAKRMQERKLVQLLQNLTDLLGKTFSSQFVFPALGHDDPTPRKELGKMWSRWLPTDSLNTFESGGYYMIERKTLKLQIVVLNTNLMRRADNDEDANRQWDWLNKVLHKCQLHKETVYLVGHMPPGSDERQRGTLSYAYSDHNNRRYIQLVRKYADIIVGQFFGHLHSDSFRIIYNEGRAVSWAMLAPSLTPRRTTDGPNNPGLRLYKFDKDTGQVIDYTQYYLDLSNANRKGEAEWVVEYNFSSYYGITNITPLSLHNLAEKLTQYSPSGNPTFTRYYRANSVRIHNESQIHICDLSCAHNHYCAITRIDYHEHEDCLRTAASALASSSVCNIRTSLVAVFLTNVLLCIL